MEWVWGLISNRQDSGSDSFGSNRKPVCDFLCVNNSVNDWWYGAIMIIWFMVYLGFGRNSKKLRGRNMIIIDH